ncbi:hypothetical protein Belba_0794 [Belliella baltica DSM 15883]|uniref:Uncharacterized protein n=1 Tax=Belliella baltica (strain DSM 15883 / CIP 108006 / LMG 21964 / BA134) TaxID=866536 RepID=I3Z2H4_BELBD|nr:hypothetical protein [Belliella baltica]AFL83442.1 hypothetical protein Belba_0794 [Belliella baltica DSM 15883]
MKKAFSFALLFYLIMMMLTPVHAEDHCDHGETHTEQHESDHADNQCCPPFSVCKLYSLFVYEMVWQFEGLEFDLVQITNTILIQPKYPISSIQIWQPPRQS